MSSGVLLKMEVGIYAKGRGKGLEGTLLIYDHSGEYTLSKNPGGWYTPYTRVYPPPNSTTANETDKMQCRLVALLTIRICIQTAGLAFGGTGLCSYRVRGVDGSCAKHLTVESVIYAANSHTYYY